MIIRKPCVVSLTWTLTDAQNNPIDELVEPIEFLYGGDDLLAKVEEALEGQDEGFETRIQLEPEHAFGDYDAQLVCFEARSLFPDNVEPGMTFERLPEGATNREMPRDAVYVVTEVYPEHVVLDGNHPLAGVALRLALRVAGVRGASEEEVEAGTVGSGGVSVLAAPAGGPPTVH